MIGGVTHQGVLPGLPDRVTLSDLSRGQIMPCKRFKVG